MSVLVFLPILVTVFGFFMLVKLRFFLVRNPIKILKRIMSLFRDSESRKSLALALAGTLGVGNIVGVAYGLSVGGAGCLFWIFVSSFFSAVLKYAESSLAAEKKENNRGGMSYVIKSTFGKFGWLLGAVYAVLCILLSLTMGTALQSQSFIMSLGENGIIHKCIYSLVFVIAVAFVVVGGADKISKATSFLIPMSTMIYVIICVSVILKNISSAPEVMKSIIMGAFNFRSAAGGVSAFLATKAIKEGFARGLLSNEAGAGTSAMAQSRSDLSSSDVGLLGVCEVFFDTSLLCMLTGFAVLFSGVDVYCMSGMEIISSAFSSSLGGGAVTVLFLLIFFFAFSTVICWYYYGTECIYFLFKKKKSPLYVVLFLFFIFVGFLIPSDTLILISDYLLFFMSIITLFTLYKNSESIVRLSERCGLLEYSDRGKELYTKSRKRFDL